MTRDHQHNPDPNVTAARIVAESIAKQEPLAGGDLETCWAEWSKQIQKVDQRTLTLLRAAFEAGWEQAMTGSAASLGRKGGLKGGKARAAKMTTEQRSESAKKAANSRWSSKRE